MTTKEPAAIPTLQFTKKPVTIEAIQWTGRMDCLDAFHIPELQQSLGSQSVEIHTLEGVMTADVGDWIIKGVKGEFYPCKPDIFAMSYSAATVQPVPGPILSDERRKHDIAGRLSLWLSSSMDDHARQDEYRVHIRAWLDHQDASAAVPGQSEPVERQYRTRADWHKNWSEWERCTKGQYDDYVAVPLLHDWHYEVRELYDHAQPAPVSGAASDEPTRPDLLEKLTYHAYERDDMSIDDLQETLSPARYQKVRQRTHRQLELQLLSLLAAAPQAPDQTTGETK